MVNNLEVALAEQQKAIEALTTSLREQAHFIQSVKAKLSANAPMPSVKQEAERKQRPAESARPPEWRYSNLGGSEIAIASVAKARNDVSIAV